MNELDPEDIAYLLALGFEPIIKVNQPTKEDIENRRSPVIDIYMAKFDKSNLQ